MTDQTPAVGWPFVIGRGPSVGHRVIAAPSFLVGEGRESILHSREIDPAQIGKNQRTSTVPLDDRRLTVIAMTEEMTRAKIGAVATTAGNGPVPDAPLLDMHSRPLEILYGIVVVDRAVVSVAAADLSVAREVAIRAYAGFLEDETDESVVATDAFAMTSSTQSLPPRVPNPLPVPVPPVNPDLPPSAETTGRSVAVASVFACLGLVAGLVFASLGGSEPSPPASGPCLGLTAVTPTCVITLQSVVDDPLPLTVRSEGAGVAIDHDCPDVLAPRGTCNISVRLGDTTTIDAAMVVDHGEASVSIPIRSAVAIQVGG